MVYINGQPHSPRDPADLHHNLNISASMDEMDNLDRLDKMDEMDNPEEMEKKAKPEPKD